MGKTASLRTQDSPVESDIDKAAFDVQPTDASLTKLPVGDSHVDHEDPLSEFSKKEISRAWLKVDLHILPVAVLLYLSSYIDRLVFRAQSGELANDKSGRTSQMRRFLEWELLLT